MTRQNTKPKRPLDSSLWERIVAVVFAVLTFATLLFLVIRNEPFSDPNLVVVFRIALSVASGILGATIPGFLNVSWKQTGLGVRAGGALALFLLSYVLSPKVIPDRVSVLEREISSLEETTSDLALAPHYRPLDSDVAANIIRVLTLISAEVRAGGIRVEVLCAPNEVGRYKLGEEIVSLLSKAGVPVMAQPGTQTIVRVGTVYTIVISGRKEHARISRALSRGLGIITNSPIPVELVEGGPKKAAKTIAVSIQGDPFFGTDGRVHFR